MSQRTPSHAARTSSPPVDGVAIAVVALAVYLCLGRYAWHGIDTLALLNAHCLGRGDGQNARYTFYAPLLHVGQALVAPFGGGVYRGALLLSAAGVALGVWFTHAAARTLAATRGAALFAALLVATMPATTYFAVLAEVPGVVLPFCGLGWLCMARWAKRPTLGGAVVVGSSLSLAFLAHPLAAMMGMAMLPMFALVQPAQRWRDLAAGTSSALAVLILGMLLLPMLARGLGGATDAATSFDFFLRRWAAPRSGGFGGIVAREWLVPFLPVSVALLVLTVRRRSARAALCTLAATVPFLIVSSLLLLDSECEWGAYATAIAGPSAIVVATYVRAIWLRGVSLVVSTTTAIVLGLGLQETPGALATAAAIEAAGCGHSMLWLVGDGAGPDGQVWLTRYPGCGFVVLASFLGRPAAKLAGDLAALDGTIARNAANGVTTIVTSTTLDTLRSLVEALPSARQLYEWLAARRGPALGSGDGVVVYAVLPPS
ncbi:MAG TPA: glycosyltransferase family 39 protein [Planctomycetota bacterium]|nr:glycosyltransferase family 39 protein [Planctomycetota bacterium]